jgi:hypothetical protein
LSEEIDGSQLEGNNPEPTEQDPTPNKVPSFISGQPEATTEGTPPAAEGGGVEVPEKFLGKSTADVIKSYQELESRQGRLGSQLGTEKQQRIALEQRLNAAMSQINTAQPPQSSPTEPDKGALEGDLNELFYDKGADVVKQIVQDALHSENTARDAAQQTKDAEFLTDRDNQITSYAQSELEVIATELGEGGISPVVLQQIAHLDRVDPDLAALRNDPTLTPDRVREETRKLYERAKSDIVSEAGKLNGTPDTAQLEAFQQAQKSSANGSPSDSASARTTAATTSDPKIQKMISSGWDFLIK